jgi:alpha-methylacyl-CoA racemase
MEKLGAGPDVAMARNPGLIYARLTGWGQDGPFASMAGHDINYIALTGTLSCFGRKGEKPIPPVNLLGDFAGGGMLCAMGIAMALFERTRSGAGQVVDSAMVDGASHLASFLFGFRHAGIFNDERGTNLLDTGAPFYDTYETADGKYMSVGSIEPQFYAALLDGLGLAGEDLPHQYDRERWPETAALFTETFKSKSRAQWTEIFDGTDACVAPVVTLPEALEHPHNVARKTFVPAVNGDLAPQASSRRIRRRSHSPHRTSRGPSPDREVRRSASLPRTQQQRRTARPRTPDSRRDSRQGLRPLEGRCPVPVCLARREGRPL